jgi:hypothetical protein
MNATGIRLSAASVQTGYSTKQLRYLAQQKSRLRWRKAGGVIVLHQQDVEALASAAWSGSPFTPAQEAER